MEIKNTTWSAADLALFPDTVTERGQKHLEELMHVLPDARAVLIPCVSRSDVTRFAPGDSADPRYGELFRRIDAGVEVIPASSALRLTLFALRECCLCKGRNPVDLQAGFEGIGNQAFAAAL